MYTHTHVMLNHNTFQQLTDGLPCKSINWNKTCCNFGTQTIGNTSEEHPVL